MKADEINLHAKDIEKMLYIWSYNEEVIIECSRCDNDDYVFSKNCDSTPVGWITKCIVHHQTHHPEAF